MPIATALKVRAANTADIPVIMALEKHAATAAHWSPEQYQELLSNAQPRRVALVLEEDNVILGFLVARTAVDEWEIENVVVAGPARWRGLGTRLLGEFLGLAAQEGAQAVYLEVRESNLAARALYEKWAFLEGGRRPRYYRSPEEDAILYRLHLL